MRKQVDKGVDIGDLASLATTCAPWRYFRCLPFPCRIVMVTVMVVMTMTGSMDGEHSAPSKGTEEAGFGWSLIVHELRNLGTSLPLYTGTPKPL